MPGAGGMHRRSNAAGLPPQANSARRSRFSVSRSGRGLRGETGRGPSPGRAAARGADGRGLRRRGDGPDDDAGRGRRLDGAAGLCRAIGRTQPGAAEGRGGQRGHPRPRADRRRGGVLPARWPADGGGPRPPLLQPAAHPPPLSAHPAETHPLPREAVARAPRRPHRRRSLLRIPGPSDGPRRQRRPRAGHAVPGGAAGARGGPQRSTDARLRRGRPGPEAGDDRGPARPPPARDGRRGDGGRRGRAAIVGRGLAGDLLLPGRGGPRRGQRARPDHGRHRLSQGADAGSEHGFPPSSTSPTSTTPATSWWRPRPSTSGPCT